METSIGSARGLLQKESSYMILTSREELVKNLTFNFRSCKHIRNLSNKVNVVAIQQQRGGADCGVLATAVCLAIATGEDPANVRWRQANMRMHLKQCICRVGDCNAFSNDKQTQQKKIVVRM